MPIVTSLLDIDWYKLTMAQFVFHRYPDVPVIYGLTNRTVKVRLAETVLLADLRDELEAVQRLTFRADELAFLAAFRRADGTPLYGEDFLGHLASLRLSQFSLSSGPDGQIDLRFVGPWAEAIFWETIALSIVNELYYRQTAPDRDAAYREGEVRLAAKIERLQRYPEVRITEFGTRRRFSKEWQTRVAATLANQLPTQLTGTSNALLAMTLGLPPRGTMAHELFMVLAAVSGAGPESLRASHGRVLTEWYQEYGDELSVALTDTFGSEFFFHDFTAEQARAWRGLRHDSGDPAAFGATALAFYERYGIDSREKQLLFSDGLDVETIVSLWERFHGSFQLGFGWGTNLTNDLGYAPLSLVVKVVEAAGRGTVKLSDNPAKAQGSPADIARYAQAFGHRRGAYRETTY